MDEITLRALLDRATATEPPIGPLARNSLRAGIRLRRRRRLTSAATSATAVAVLAGGVPAITGAIGSPDVAGHRPVKPTAYVATGGQTVVPISLATNAAGKPIKLTGPGGIQGMAITADGRTVYVENAQGEMTPINTATNSAGRPFRVGFDASEILITPSGKSAYVFEEFRGVVPVNLAQRRQLHFIKVSHASGIAMTPDGKTVYVVSGGGYSASKIDTVTPIRTATDTALRPIKLTAVSFSPRIVIAPDGRTAYVTDPSGPYQRAATITPINLATGTALKPIMLSRAPLPSAFTIDITPDGKTAYAAGLNGVTPINLVTRRVLKLIKLPQASLGLGYDLEITPDSRAAFALPALGTSIYPINLSNNKPLKPIRLGRPRWLAYSIDLAPNGYAFIGRQYNYKTLGAGAITLIRIATGKVTKTIFMPDAPGQIVFAP